MLRVGEQPLVAVNSPSNEEVLQAKYAKVVLVHRGELHAVTDVVYCVTKGAWCVHGMSPFSMPSSSTCFIMLFSVRKTRSVGSESESFLFDWT
eukprot:COSAG01_NODE_2133_length_8348_cov_440.231058_11_plen_93_part_00